MSLKNITSDESGVVSMSWTNAGSFDDAGMGLLDDIWESKMPSSTSKNQRRTRALNDDDSPGTQSKRPKVSGGMSSSGETPQQTSNKRSHGGGASGSAKTTAASLIRSLNGCDTLLLESKQCLGLFATSEMCATVPVLSVSKLVDKLEAKLTSQSVEALTQGWEPGQPENRGCELVTNMKSMLSSLMPAKALASCLQAKRGQEDPMGLASVTGYFKLWIMVR